MTAQDQPPEPIGIVSGTGPAGRALVRGLALSGQPVVVGSRDPDRSAAAVSDITSTAAALQQPDLVRSGSNRSAARCSLVVIATNANHAVSQCQALAPLLTNKIVVSIGAKSARSDRGFRPDPPQEGSIASAIQQVLPTAHVVAALQHLPAAALADPTQPADPSVLVCGNHMPAVAEVIERLGPVTTGHFFDAGGLENAAAVEAMTAVLLTINATYRSAFSLRVINMSRR